MNEGFESIAQAWERVFEDIVDIGSSITDIYRTAYDAERAGPSPDVAAEEPEGRRDRMTEVSQTVERSIRAARETFDEVTSRATTSERPKELTHEIEDAVAISLRELGGALQRLSDQIGRGREVEPPADDTGPA